MLTYLHQSTIYEVNLRQYTPEGTINAFRKHLPRLKSMGMDILWFMPIHPIGEKNKKGTAGSYYSSQNFFELHPTYGTKEDFITMVDEIHQLGMKIMLDWVANHAAWDNNWTLTHPEFFLRDDAGAFVTPFDWTDVIQIDHQHEPAHEAMIAAMSYWVKEFDIDGFRADLAHLTPLPFWIKARNQISTIKSNLIWLAETEDANYYESFDIVFAWKWMHRTEDFVKNHLPLQELTHVLHEQNHPYPSDAMQMFFTSNHDENSWNGTEYEKYGVYAQAFAVFSFFYKSSIPLVYTGQEIPVRKRISFFDKDALNWNEPITLHEFYQVLAIARKACNSTDDFSFISFPNNIMACKRTGANNTILMFINLDEKPVDIKYDLGNSCYKNIFDLSNYVHTGNLDWYLQPGEFAVLQSTP